MFKFIRILPHEAKEFNPLMKIITSQNDHELLQILKENLSQEKRRKVVTHLVAIEVFNGSLSLKKIFQRLYALGTKDITFKIILKIDFKGLSK